MRDSVDAFRDAGTDSGRGAVLAGMNSGRFTTEIESHLRDVLTLYTSELSNIQGRFTITTQDTVLTQNISTIEAATLRSELAAATAAISSTMAFSAVGNSPNSVNFRELNDSFIEGKVNRLQVGLVTNMAGFRSSFEIRKAETVADNPKFEYVGPSDSKNRPFCRFVLANRKKEWTRAEIERELDSRPDAQLLPTFVYGGGYNCRHRWIYTQRA